MMSENIARNMESSQGTINYPTLLKLVDHFRILYYHFRHFDTHLCTVSEIVQLYCRFSCMYVRMFLA